MKKELIDNYGRTHDYLRISVTDRCNLRCVYCMGEEGVPWIDHQKILSFEEIIKVVETAAELGVTKIRLTGGEPLVRKGIENLVSSIASIPGIKDIAMTTNGILLAEKARQLKEAGLNRVNISLDTLIPEVYRKITRLGDLKDALNGIKAAIEYGFKPVKINVVLMKGINDTEIDSFLRMAIEQPVHMRFIEYMPIDSHDTEWKERYLPLQAVLDRAEDMGMVLEPIASRQGSGPADSYNIRGALGKLGLIHPISKHFCSECNRLRLTPEGYLKPCLFWTEELPVRPFINDPDMLKTTLKKALNKKRDKHDMKELLFGEAREQSLRGMSMIGG